MATILTRFEIKIPPDKREQYEAAAKTAGMSLSAWMQQAADHELRGLPGELLIEALEATWNEMLDDLITGKVTLSDSTMQLVRAALESVGRL